MFNRLRRVASAGKAVSRRSSLPETLGFILLGIGGFMLLSLASYNPADSVIRGLEPASYHNKAGPIGAGLAHLMLLSIGLVSYLWTATLLLTGFVMAFGFIRWPRPRRFVGLFLLTFVLAGLIHVQWPDLSFFGQPAGPGGIAGVVLGGALHDSVGYAGALIVLCLTGIAFLVLTRNLAASRTAHLFDDGLYHFRRVLKRPKAPAPGSATRTGGKQGKVAPEPRTGPPAGAGRTLNFSSSGPSSATPDPKIFQVADLSAGRRDYSTLSQQLEAQLREFKVAGRICRVTEGPVVTTMEFEPAPGIKTSEIAGLSKDLARLMAAESLRILAPIPGKNTVGFEVPNEDRKTIRFGNALKEFTRRAKKMALPVILGVDTFGNTFLGDLAEMPHLLVAGSTGSGKSVFINTLIASLVYRRSAAELRFVMIDPKMIELASYNSLPHLACPVVTDLQINGEAILNGLVQEMEDRYRRLGALGARNIEAFNETVATSRRSHFTGYEGRWEPMPYVVLVVDEFADIMLVMGKTAETAVTRLAQKARAAGIHLVIATQRPSVDVVTGLVKANFPTRIAFRMQSGVDSRTILDQTGAETLLGKGDMLFQSAGSIKRLHAPYLEAGEVSNFVRACAA